MRIQLLKNAVLIAIAIICAACSQIGSILDAYGERNKKDKQHDTQQRCEECRSDNYRVR